MATFEGYERRIGKIQPVLEQYGFATLDEANEYCLSKGIDV
ncbi:MAG: GGGtGRT protein, partial [Clostridia bacterium]|nr:GGGtGRT protein [Clostridia bacterium]